MRRMIASGLAAGLVLAVAAGPGTAQEREPQVLFNVPTYELERVEVPEAGVAMLLPVDWPLEVRMEELGYGLPPEHEDAETPTVWDAFRVESDIGDWCDLKIHVDNPMPLDEHALWDEQSYAANASDGVSVERSTIVVGDGIADQIDFTSATGPEHMRVFLFESAGTRYELTCFSSYDENLAWYEMAHSVEPLGAEPADAGPLHPELQRVEMSEAAIAVSFPADWSLEGQMEQFEIEIPPELEDASPVYAWAVMRAYQDAVCSVWLYEHSPMSIDEHAAWIERMNTEDPAFDGTFATSRVQLPAGEAIRIVSDYPAEGVASAAYLVEAGERRYQISCTDDEPAADAYLSIAETIEILAAAPESGVPAEAVDWSVVEDFTSVVPVRDEVPSGSLDATLMSADCQRALWLEFADGTFEERLECTLSDDPVIPPEWQGARPTEPISLAGGECEWVSDFWAVQDGSEVWASSWSVTVDPAGEVSATASYQAEALDCPAG